MMAVFRAGMAVAVAACIIAGLAPDAAAQVTPEIIIQNNDADGDGRVAKSEWRRNPKRFKILDSDGDGYLTIDELRARLGGAPAGGQGAAVGSGTTGPMSDGQVPPPVVGRAVICAIGRGRRCDIKLAVARGLFETGLSPRFPDGLSCRGIDETWAMDYTFKRDRVAYHGGIDMPAPYGTPMRAVADGTVVSRVDGAESYRGIELILRHSPEDTGLPMWTYTQYAHFDEAPKHTVGQRVKMGEVLGPTVNSGRSGGKRVRRPAIHFAVWYSQSPSYAVVNDTAIPMDGWWMDLVAFYRKAPPFDSTAMKALPSDRKQVDIPVLVEGGAVVPAGSKVIWPYTCAKD